MSPKKPSLISSILSFIIVGLRPLFGPVNCTFAIGCTTYATIQLQEKPLFHALYLILKRLLACCSLLRKPFA